MYYIYHIKGVKWGCTKRSVKRRVWEQGYTLNDVCEIVEQSDINIASDLEKELNIRDGYSWNDSQDYRVILKAAEAAKLADYDRYIHTFTKEECVLGAYMAGKYPTQKARNARRTNMNKLNEYKTCPHCGIYSRGLGYNRYHGDKCKLNLSSPPAKCGSNVSASVERLL